MWLCWQRGGLHPNSGNGNDAESPKLGLENRRRNSSPTVFGLTEFLMPQQSVALAKNVI